MRSSSSVVKIWFVIVLFILPPGVFLSCDKVDKLVTQATEEEHFLILYTNDEHGHIYEPGGEYRASALAEMWAEEEKACPDCHVIKLSGGDNYTGAAISSVFRGESTAKVFRELGYRASVVGNHEFDFGLAPFRKNEKLSGITYLAANIVDDDFNTPFGTRTTIDVGDTTFGIIGITTGELKRLSFSKYLTTAHIVESDQVVERNMRKLEDIADFFVVLTHQPLKESLTWADSLDNRPIIVFNGHAHESYLKNIRDTLFVQAGKNLRNYARIEITRKNGRYYVTDADLVKIKRTADFSTDASKQIKATIDTYNKKLEKIAGRVIIQADRDLSFRKFQRLYACSLKHAYPGSDIGMSNPDAFRDRIRRGAVKLRHIISMLPFENRVVVSEIFGRHLTANLERAGDSLCGARKKDGVWYIGKHQLNPEKKYRVVIHEFIHSGGDYFEFRQKDTISTLTSQHWRAPLISYLEEAAARGKKIHEAYTDIISFLD